MNKFGDNDFIILLLYLNDKLIVGHNASKINNLKRRFSKYFATKDLGPTKQILGMKIFCDREIRKLCLSQEAYVERVLERFNMDKAKFVCFLFADHFKLSYEHYLTSEKEKHELRGIFYT